MLYLIETTWKNRFNKSYQLVRFSTGTIASSVVCSDLLNAKEKSESAFKAFKEQRLESETTSQTIFYDKLKLKTLNSIKQTKKTKVSNKEVILKADNKLFVYIILVASSRNLSIQGVLKHPLGPLLCLVFSKCRWVNEENQLGFSCKKSRKKILTGRKCTKRCCCHSRWDGNNQRS